MEIRNILFIFKYRKQSGAKLSVVLCACLLLLGSGCSSVPTEPTVSESPPAVPAAAAALRAQPKIGLILGPGGWKAMAAIGVLREFEKNGIPIHAISGLEMGAVVAGLYAQNPSANFVEWTLGKIKSESLHPTKIFGRPSPQGRFSAVADVVREASKQPIQATKLPFACPGFTIATERSGMLKAGALDEVLAICSVSPPVFAADGPVVSAVSDIPLAAEWLRSKGAELIVLVNPMAAGTLLKGQASVTERLLWHEVRQSISNQSKSIDFVIGIHTRDYEILSFDATKSFILFGSQAGRVAAQKLSEKFGF